MHSSPERESDGATLRGGDDGFKGGSGDARDELGPSERLDCVDIESAPRVATNRSTHSCSSWRAPSIIGISSLPTFLANELTCAA